MSGLAPSVIVLEGSEEERVPTEEEVVEYAEFLGIDPKTEPELMWIAKEGVVAPVPPPWKACTENGDDVFYFNFETGDSVWDHPCDEKYRMLVEEHRGKACSPASAKSEEEASFEARPASLAPLSPLEPLDMGCTEEPQGGPQAKVLPPLNLSSASSALREGPQAKADSAQKDTPVTESKRLELITNEISDDDSVSERSPTSPQDESADGMSSPVAAGSRSAAASKTEADRGTAGVGLAAAGGLAVDTSLDKSGEVEDQTGGTAQSSPRGTPSQQSQSASGGRGVPLLAPKVGGSSVSGAGRSGLEHSGQSGKSSNLSEVSEDFPSEFDGHSEAHAHGDTLELSATMEDSAPGPPATVSAAAAAASRSAVADAEAPGAQGPGARLQRVQDDVAALARVLSKLRDIRGTQKEYLQLLQAAC